MSASDDTPTSDSTKETTASSDASPDRDALEARIELLEAETERLRSQYAQAKRTQYRRTALGLAGVGGVALVGGLVFPAVRDVLVIIAAIGLFGGLLSYYLTPERFVAADVAEQVYETLAENEAALTADLGLSDDRVVLPTPAADQPATLFLPQDSTAPLPDPAAIEGPLVVTETTQGLALTPSGAGLFTESDAGRVTLACADSAYPTAFDPPIASLLATALAVGLETPVAVTTRSDDETDLTVTCQWTPASAPTGEDGAGNRVTTDAEPVADDGSS